MKKVYLRLYDYGHDILFTIADNETKRSIHGVVELKPKEGIKSWTISPNHGFSRDTEMYSDRTRIM